jgi:hypothetical protein
MRIQCLIYIATQTLKSKLISISNLFQTSSPVLDDNRGYADGTKIITDIEGGNVYNVRKASEDHFSIQMRPDEPSDFIYPDHHSYWFYFRIEGVKGKEIRIDVTNCHWMRSHWKKYRPVYSYAEDPDNLTDVSWNRIEKTKLRWSTFSLVQKFEMDHAWVALRYPYNYTRQMRYLDSIRDREYLDIEDLGMTAKEKSLYMITVTDKGVPHDRKRGILVYAREHGAEQDGSWVAEGMIDFLLSPNDTADILRQNFIFMIIPIISPDSVVLGRTTDPITGKCVGGELSKEKMDSVEAMLLYDRMKRFVETGRELDICISFHNPHGTEPNIYPTYRPYKDAARLEKGKNLHRMILKNAVQYTTWKEFNYKSCNYSVGRFAKDFGSAAILYEVNHQAKNNYLSLENLKGVGEVFLKGIKDYYELNNDYV